MALPALLWRNEADRAVVSATSSLTLAQPRRLLAPHTSTRVRWQSRSGNASLTLRWPAPVTIDTAALVALRAGTVRWRVSSADVTGLDGDLFDGSAEAVDQAFGQALLCLPAPVTAIALRADLASNAAHVAAGRFVAGRRQGFAAGFDRGWSRGWVDPSVRTTTLGGQIGVSARESYRYTEVTFPALTDAEADGFVDAIDGEAGTKRDVLFIRDPAAPDLARQAIWGLMAQLSAVTNRHFNLNSKTYYIEERL